jgi:hypothetical protein
MPPPYILVSAPNRPSTIQVGNSRDPAENPIVLPFNFDFTVATGNPKHLIDLTQTFQSGAISQVQTMYFDNSKNDVPVVVTIQGSSQTITMPIGAQGYVPILCPQPGVMQLDGTASTTGTAVYVGLINVPMPTDIWFPYDAHTHG